ncbi:MAG: caspase family protein [Deltaproteobacteria bacterium]|nr:caspase family protein [Deltaproteobacteria bacterium]MBI3389962.1 caspase family protein [Deltaproteobacteria bacterium]
MKAIDDILTRLPLPILIGATVIAGSAWLIRELGDSKSYGPALRARQFWFVVVAVVAADTVYYGGQFWLLRLRGGQDCQILVAKFKGDDGNHVQDHLLETLYDVSKVSRPGAVAAAMQQTVATPSDADTILGDTKTETVLWGIFIPPSFVHLRISNKRTGIAYLSIANFPDLSSVQPALVELVQAPPKPNSPISTTAVARPLPRPSNGQALHKIVLSIGIDRYVSFPHLNSSVSSAREIAAIGRDQNASVRFLADATRSAILDELAELEREVSVDDQVWVFLSASGVSLSNTAYFLASDSDPESIPTTSIDMHVFADRIRRLNARQILLVADACYAGALGDISHRGISPGGVDAQVIAERQGFVLLTATGRDQLAFESARWGGSAFARALIDGLLGAADIDGDGTVSVDELVHFIQVRVRELTEDTQHPMRWGDSSFTLTLVGR